MRRTDLLVHALGTKVAIVAAAGVLLAAGLAQVGTVAADSSSPVVSPGPSEVLMAPLGQSDTGSTITEGGPVLMAPLTDGHGPVQQ